MLHTHWITAVLGLEYPMYSIKVRQLGKKGVRNTQTEEMRTKESIQSLATSCLSVWSNKWHYLPHKPCLICILGSAHLQHSFWKEVWEWLTGCSQAKVGVISPICHPSHLVIETPAAAWAGGQQIPAAASACAPRECTSPSCLKKQLEEPACTKQPAMHSWRSMNPAQAASLELWECWSMSGSESNLIYLPGLQDKC